MVWLNPKNSSNPQNKINYMTGTNNDVWELATTSGYKDSNGNILYKFDVGQNNSVYNLNKTFNLYTNTSAKPGFGINGNTVKLETQQFIFRAWDGSTASTQTITLTGDTETPNLEFKTIKLGGTTENIGKDSNGNEIEPPTFPKQTGSVKATITGTWSDKFNSTISNTTKFATKTIEWGTGAGKKTADITLNSGNSWTAEIAPPDGGGTITAKLIDYAGNKIEIQTAARIEKDDLGIARIGCNDDDKSYKAGDLLEITLEFTKNTRCEIPANGTKPTLTMNAGGTAIYKSGSGTASHIYEYTVPAGTTDIPKLKVTGINQGSAKWYDAAVTDETQTLNDKIAYNKIPTGCNLDDTRNIKIDRTAPTITKLEAVNDEGYYNAEKSIMFLMEFSEPVKITNVDNLEIQFTHHNKVTGTPYATTTEAEESGSYVLFTYDISTINEAQATLQFNALNHAGVSITDEAGNVLANWNPATKDFKNIVIDTQAPAAPTFKNNWNPERMLFAPETTDVVTSFELQGEADASFEYSVDNGNNWLSYTPGGVKFRNNNTYRVKARQTDIAGNQSPATDVKTFTIDKGDVLTRISATTVNGSYSLNTSTKKINGIIEFGKSITLKKDSNVTLNVKNPNSTNTDKIIDPIKINECKTSAATSKSFTFTYEIAEGDYIDNNDRLDVIAWSLETNVAADKPTINAGGENVKLDLPLPAATSEKSFTKNREIYILTGKPKIETTNGIFFEGEDSNAKLKINFDRIVSKVGGKIIITQDISSGQYHVPVVIPKDEYNALHQKIPTQLDAYYTKGVCGTDNKLNADTTTKYILDFATSDTQAQLITAFTTTAKTHIVEIPVVADEVAVTSNGGKSIMTIDLSSTYKLPVKGAKYTVSVPAGCVTDAVQNKNDAKTTDLLQSPGVEKPTIRIKKSRYTINNAGNTKNATANMTSAQSAQMKIDCRTPGATLKYATNELISNGNRVVTVNAKDTFFDTKKADPTVPTTINTSYTSGNTVTFASGTNYAVTTYDNSYGVKIAISATATANSKTATAWEYAARTVLKFNINGYDNNADHGGVGSTAPANLLAKEAGLTFKDLKVWVSGGDAPYGGNTVDPFPFEWADPKYFMLMAGSHSSNDANNMQGSWYLVTWEVTIPTYHNFNIGTVPTDAATNGPSIWYSSECSWVTQKKNFVLYPGETLVMDTASTSPNFLFRDKNEGMR